VQLGMDGNTAGVGDVVQARENNWRLPTPVLNRQTFKVTETLDDGALRVEREDGELVTLPASYVREHVTLAYASTVHAAQGRTVDTTHAVLSSTSRAADAYVAMTRGRESNHAYLVTWPSPADSPSGATLDVEQRSPAAVFSDILERAEEQRTALAEKEQAEIDARSTKSVVDKLIDAVEHVTAGRTSRVLDKLAADGTLTEEQREQLAVDPATRSLEQLLRRAELAGHDPEQLLTAAVERRELDDVTSPAKVLHHRISTELRGQLTPHVTSARDLIPATADDTWRPYMERLADAADERRRELGAQIAEQQPEWAVAALGEVPTDPVERAEWEHRAGWAAAWRELAEHTDERDALGRAPAPGLVEKAALYRAGHEQLGLIDRGAEEAELSEGALRARVAAYQRLERVAPAYVADDLAEAEQELRRARRESTLMAAKVEVADAQDREELRAAAERAVERAAAAERRVEVLTEQDRLRGLWYGETAGEREITERSKAELLARGVDLDAEPKVTAEQWLAAEREARLADDPHREITEADIADERDRDYTPVRADEPMAEYIPAPAPAKPGPMPTVKESWEEVARARSVLAGLALERQLDEQREADRLAWEYHEQQSARADERVLEM